MHEDQVPTSVDLVRRLLAAQHPRWADLPVRPVAEAGTDHALYRLGEELLVRLPIVGWAQAQAERDARWLPVLGPHLPLDLPVPVASGEPGEGYPWRWSVVPWVDGHAAEPHRLDLPAAARDLAALVRALHAVPTDDGPAKTGTDRGASLRLLDEPIRDRLRELRHELDASAVARVWAEAVDADVWEGEPVWIHGDLQPGNLIARDRRLAAVIDFGGLGLGDPAPDLAPAWNLFDAETRETFLDAVGYDDHTRARARGWVLAPALTGVGYYRDTRPDLAATGRRQIESVLADAG